MTAVFIAAGWKPNSSTNIRELHCQLLQMFLTLPPGTRTQATPVPLIFNFYSLRFSPGLKSTEDVKGQRCVAIVRPGPCWGRLQSGRRPTRWATRPRLLSGTKTTGQKKLQSERVSAAPLWSAASRSEQPSILRKFSHICTHQEFAYKLHLLFSWLNILQIECILFKLAGAFINEVSAKK